jgi:hypothetical protein
LADDLFKDRQEFADTLDAFHELHELVPSLLPKTGRSLEEVLQRLKNEGADNLKRRQELTAVRYYLRQIFTDLTDGWWDSTRHISNYASLLGQMRRSSNDALAAPFHTLRLTEADLLERAV